MSIQNQAVSAVSPSRTTVLPVRPPFKMVAIPSLSPRKGISRQICSRRSNFHSWESFSHALYRMSMGQLCELTPMRETPLKIKGNTVMGSSGDAALPQQVTTPMG